MGVWCAAIVALTTAPAPNQGFPTRIKLTGITTNAGAFVKTTITEKDIIARCASDNSVDPARLKLLFVNGDVGVVDIVSTNMTCSILTFNGDIPTNVSLVVASGANSNSAKAIIFTPINSLAESLLPADLAGTAVGVYSASVRSNILLSATLKATVQAGSVSNNTVYTGTISIGGKPFTFLPE